MPVEAVRADITTLAVDAVVNAANRHLHTGSGVCGAIFAAAGDGLAAACDAIGACDTGDAVATPGFALAAPWIIHTVGPVWRDGTRGEADHLASCYQRSLEVAADLGARSIAFPAIATGVYGYPADQAAEIAVTTTVASSTPIERVLLVAFDTDTLERYQARLR